MEPIWKWCKNLRNGGTINYSTGIATIYGDYSSTSGYGAALLIHEDYEKHDKVTIVYNHGPGNEVVDYITYSLDNVNGVNQNWTVDGKKIVQFVQNKNVQYYNLRFFNVEGDIAITSSGGITYTSSLKLNNDGTVSQDVTATLGDYNENYSATVDDVVVPLVAKGASLYQVKLPSLAPARLTQERVIKIYDGNDVVNEKTTSAVEYLMAIVDGEYNANLKAFSKAMLNYAAYCQVYFDVEAINLANKDLDTEDKNVDSITADSNNDRAVDGSTDGITFKGQSLNLGNSTNLKVYFQITSGVIEDYIFKDGDTVLTPSYDAEHDYYYVTVRMLLLLI